MPHGIARVVCYIGLCPVDLVLHPVDNILGGGRRVAKGFGKHIEIVFIDLCRVRGEVHRVSRQRERERESQTKPERERERGSKRAREREITMILVTLNTYSRCGQSIMSNGTWNRERGVEESERRERERKREGQRERERRVTVYGVCINLQKSSRLSKNPG